MSAHTDWIVDVVVTDKQEALALGNRVTQWLLDKAIISANQNSVELIELGSDNNSFTQHTANMSKS